jgi:hypothetical protein
MNPLPTVWGNHGRESVVIWQPALRVGIIVPKPDRGGVAVLRFTIIKIDTAGIDPWWRTGFEADGREPELG